MTDTVEGCKTRRVLHGAGAKFYQPLVVGVRALALNPASPIGTRRSGRFRARFVGTAERI